MVNFILDEPSKMFEARLLINAMFTATHFVYGFDSNTLVDEGIDGEERKVLATKFLEEYREKYWIVDNIVGDDDCV